MSEEQVKYLRDREAFFNENESGFLAELEELRKEREESKKTRLRFKRLHPDAVSPNKAHETDSGFDLYAVEDLLIEPGESAVVPTGIAFDIPEGYEIQVRPKSGITSKTKLRVQFGTIDEDFIGDVGVMVDNTIDSRTLTTARHDHYFDISGGYINASEYFETRNDFLLGSYLIRKGDKIAQGVLAEKPNMFLEETTDDLEPTERGDGGYGSTGLRKEDE